MLMKKISRKSVITLPVLCVMLLTFTSCGKVKSASELEKYAEKTYGACEIVSQSKTDDRTALIVHDELQDFDYSIESVMESVNVDGGIWGKYVDIHSGFDGSLKDKVIQNVTDKLDSECKRSNARWEKEEWWPGLISIYATDEASAKEVALFCAEILQTENLNNRMDGWEIRVYVGGEQTGEERVGTITLPDISLISVDEEHDQYYIRMAHIQTDPNAVFLRKEIKTFADTGADLNRVDHPAYDGTSDPTSDSSPVTFYYFRASDGSEYYLCDFLYYEGDSRDAPKWYTNYGG